MSVDLIDPNDAVNEYNFANGVPEYEKMFIFAELIAERRGRTVIVSKGNGTFDINRTIDSDLVVNMLGPDRESGNFTTKWGDATSTTKNVYEGFGITKINIRTNASFIPVVTIDFVDIRGLAFFNGGKNSPYAVLHDFPPPIFQLTVKGYYGKSLTYQLHLVRQNTTFEGESGNYRTTAEFVARTFAPLTDVLFKYAELFPLMKKDSATRPSPQANAGPVGSEEPLDRNVRPVGIHNLLSNIETLYQKLDKVSKDSEVKEDLEKKEDEYLALNTTLNEVNAFANALEDEEYDTTNTALLTKTPTPPEHLETIDKFSYGLTTINNVRGYQQALTDDKTVSINLNNKLFLGIKLNSEIVEPEDISTSSKFDSTKYKKAQKTLNNYRKEFIDSFPRRIVRFELGIKSEKEQDLANAVYSYTKPKYVLRYLESGSDQGKYEKTYYAVIEITPIYQKLYKFYVEDLVVQITELEKQFVTLVNNLAELELEMKPTIRNIFEVICDDVDIFFDELKNTSVKAQEHHNDPVNKSVIAGNNSNTDLPEQITPNKQVIDAFPLYIETTTVEDSDVSKRGLNQINSVNDCKRITRKQKAYPGKRGGIGLLTTEPFPEVELVDRFLKVFVDIKNEETIKNIREQQNANGDLVFIPSTPYDSTLGNEDAYESPYIPSSVEGGVGSELVLNQILNVLLDRFYVFSQYTYGESFYTRNTIIDSFSFTRRLAEYSAEAEASNIAISLLNTNNNLDNVIRLLESFQNGENFADNLYTYMSENGITNYNSNKESILLGKSATGFDPIYKNKINNNYFGLKIIDDEDNIEEKTVVADNPVDKFVDENKDNVVWQGIKDFFGVDEVDIAFSKENVQIVKDIGDDTTSNTRYIFLNKNTPSKQSEGTIIQKMANIFSFAKVEGTNNDDVFRNDEAILDYLEDDTKSDESKFFLISSVFTFSKNIFTKLNDKFLDVPAAISVPTTFLLYSGGLLLYESEFQAELEPLFEEFKKRYYLGNNSYSNGIVSVDDIIINQEIERTQFLSEIDKNLLIKYFSDYFNENGEIIIDEFKSILTQGVENNSGFGDYETLINNNYELISDMFITRTLVNYSELTLTYEEITEDNIETNPEEFVSLTTTNANEDLKEINDIYFNKFIRTATTKLRARKKFLQDLENEIFSDLNDDDIKNQCYYSFKNISDKWLSGLGNNNFGYPFNSSSGRLIDQFVFVDRAFNDIGDKVVIDLKPLLEYANDFDSNIFSVISRILALNGFEFFPLQNFMSFNADDWENSFKIHERLEQDSTPAFVCMYVGGVSSKLNNVVGFESVFENDGINDLSLQEDIPDFYNDTNNDCNKPQRPSTNNNEITKENRDKTTPEDAQDLQFNSVKAFRVRFGEQEQAIFKNVHLDTREFKETNESLAILAEIAQDESYSAPIPKGQNLFNTFEQRSYSCTVDMLGDMMIQPTQYFQLENIPMFSGAYLVLNVEHEFVPNHATTSFMGVRILKYPVPYITDFASSAGFKSTSVQEESAIGDDADNNVKNKNIDDNVITYVGMNELKINIR